MKKARGTSPQGQPTRRQRGNIAPKRLFFSGLSVLRTEMIPLDAYKITDIFEKEVKKWEAE